MIMAGPEPVETLRTCKEPDKQTGKPCGVKHMSPTVDTCPEHLMKLAATFWSIPGADWPGGPVPDTRPQPAPPPPAPERKRKNEKRYRQRTIVRGR